MENKEIVFGKLSSGELIAIDAETNQPILNSEGSPMNPAQYYHSVGQSDISKWTDKQKIKFIAAYGAPAYRDLHTESKRIREGFKAWTDKEKAHFIRQNGLEKYKEMVQRNK